MPKKHTLSKQSQKKLKKAAYGGLGSFIMVLLFPKSFKVFMRYFFADLAKNTLYIVLAGLLTNKIANWLIKDAPFSKRSSE